MPTVTVNRATKETDVKLKLNIAGRGEAKVETGAGFFDHMLTLFAFHAGFDLEVAAKGDLQVCAHHTVEDTGIVLGQAFYKSLPRKRNIARFASVVLPMDETLARAVVDISGRAFLVFRTPELRAKVGEFDTELVHEFFQAFVSHAQINLHLEVFYGFNTHHMIEALFKATGRALGQAVKIESGRAGVNSTKGAL